MTRGISLVESVLLREPLRLQCLLWLRYERHDSFLKPLFTQCSAWLHSYAEDFDGLHGLTGLPVFLNSQLPKVWSVDRTDAVARGEYRACN